MNIAETIEQIAEKSKPRENPGDYRENGVLYCGVCKTQKECIIEIMGNQKRVGCQCKCEKERYDEDKEEERKRQEGYRIERLRAEGIQDRTLEQCRFENARPSETIKRCKRYAGNWPTMLENNIGLLLYGGPGGGKTFAAACIANYLIDRSVPVMMTSLSRILNSGMDKSEIIDSLHRYKLMILDDLGVERKSEYAMEIVYTVVDERYKANLPLIVTTNLSTDDIKRPSNNDYARIYSRIEEMCQPLYVQAAGYRQDKADEKRRVVREVLGI